jgi:hypothetical protein
MNTRTKYHERPALPVYWFLLALCRYWRPRRPYKVVCGGKYLHSASRNQFEAFCLAVHE